jgi:hypothetical protein
MRAWGKPAGVVVALLAGVFLLHLVLWRSFEGFVTRIDHCPELFCDFVHHYYPTGKQVLQNAEPAFGYYYSPSFALVLSFVHRLTPPAALVVWGVMQSAAVALLALLAVLWLRRAGAAPLWQYAAIALTLTSFPVLNNFKWGQVSVLLVVLLLGGAYLLERARGAWAALLLAAAISIKFYPVAILGWLVEQGQVVTLLLTLGGVALLLLGVPFLLLGVSRTFGFYRGVQRGLAEATGWVATDYNSQYFPHVTCRYLGRRPKHLIRLFAQIGALAVLVYVGLVWWRGRPAREEQAGRDPERLSPYFLVQPFLLPTSWPHTLAYLPFVQLGELWLSRQARSRGWRVALAALIGLSVVLSNVVFFRLFPDRLVYNRWGMLFFANAILVLTSLIVRFVPLRTAGRQEGT